VCHALYLVPIIKWAREDNYLRGSVMLLLILNGKPIFATHVWCCFPTLWFPFWFESETRSSELALRFWFLSKPSLFTQICVDWFLQLVVLWAHRQLSVPRVVSTFVWYSLVHVCLQRRSRPTQSRSCLWELELIFYLIFIIIVLHVFLPVSIHVSTVIWGFLTRFRGLVACLYLCIKRETRQVDFGT
jgi:hypothetical protein